MDGIQPEKPGPYYFPTLREKQLSTTGATGRVMALQLMRRSLKLKA
jgi:hypothetical protein